MEKSNWKQFVLRITIDAAPETIFQAWTTQAGLERWFLRLAEFTSSAGERRKRNELIQQADRYRWLWFGYDDSFAEEKEILFTNNKDELEFSFSGGCIVRVTIKHEEGETICELLQTMPMDDEKEQQYFFIECGKGWTFYMSNLKSILEGGNDLRNKNEHLKNMINA